MFVYLANNDDDDDAVMRRGYNFISVRLSFTRKVVDGFRKHIGTRHEIIAIVLGVICVRMKNVFLA